MPQNKSYVALDVGEKRIGVAVGDSRVRIAVPMNTIEVDGQENENIIEVIAKERPQAVIIGYPRNQAGEPTAQTAFAVSFGERLKELLLDDSISVIFQDESLTSVLAEQRLKQYGVPYNKSEIDAHAAALILQDYLEQNP